MKKTARLLAVLLAVFLGMTIVAPMLVHANPPDDGGTLTIHKFIMNDLANALAANDGNVIDSSTAAALVTAGAVPKPGVTFKIYEIDLPGPTTSSASVENPNAYQAPPYSNTDWEDLIKAFANTSFTLDDYLTPTEIILASSVINPVDPGNPIDRFGVTAASVPSVTTDSSGAATAGTWPTAPLEKGFYLVVEQPAAGTANSVGDVASMSFPFIVSVPMTNADGDGWIEQVHCYPKNGDILITKEVDRNAVKIGETVTWTVDVSVPADIMHYHQFFLTDTLDNALTYVPGTLKVYAMSEKPTVDGYITLPATGRMEIPVGPTSLPNFVETLPAPGNSNTLKVEFIVGTFDQDTDGRDRASYDVDGREWLFGDFDNDGTIGAGEFGVKYVRFVFDTIVNDNILDRTPDDGDPDTYLGEHPNYTLENEAEINFQHRFDIGKTRKRTSDRRNVHTAAIIFNKVNAHTGEELDGEGALAVGAGFQIATSEENARAGIFLKRLRIGGKVVAVLDKDETWTAANGTVYSYTSTEAEDWIETSRKAVAGDFSGDSDTAHTDLIDKAIVRFEGIKEFKGRWATYPAPGAGSNYGGALDGGEVGNYGDNWAGSYWVVETQAPTDATGQTFNLLFDPIQLTFSWTVSNTTNWYTLNGGVVRNTNTFTLPRTGGIGTILFTAGGITLIGVAAVLLVLGAKKKKQKNAA